MSVRKSINKFKTLKKRKIIHKKKKKSQKNVDEKDIELICGFSIFISWTWD